MKTIKLSNANKVTIVNDKDYARFHRYRWRLSGRGYVIRHAPGHRKPRKVIFLHREIINTPAGKITDHVDGDPLNNTRKNLRVCTHQENLRNQTKQKRKNKYSRYKGVSFGYKKWIAYITLDSKTYRLGSFRTEKEAARAYNLAASVIYGDFARLNNLHK